MGRGFSERPSAFAEYGASCTQAAILMMLMATIPQILLRAGIYRTTMGGLLIGLTTTLRLDCLQRPFYCRYVNDAGPVCVNGATQWAVLGGGGGAPSQTSLQVVYLITSSLLGSPVCLLQRTCVLGRRAIVMVRYNPCYSSRNCSPPATFADVNEAN